MVVLFKSEVFRSSQRHAGCCDTLNGRVVCKVYKHDRAVDGARLAEAFDEEVRFLKRDTHSRKHNDERVVRAAHLSLTCDLCGKLGMGQTGSGEDRQLLAAHQRVQTVDGRNTGLDEFLRVVAGRRVHRQTVDVVAAVGQNLRTVVNGAAEAVENTTQHVFAYA